MFTRYSVACFLACVAVCFAQQATQDEINAFLDWFQARGGRAPKLTVKSFEGMGAGVAATAPVQDGDVVIVVPLSSVATRATIIALSPLSARDLFAAIESDEQLIATFLVQQRALGSRSEWFPYIQVLPKSIPLTLTLANSDLAEFQSSSISSAAKARRKQVNSEFESILSDIKAILVATGVSAADVEKLPLKDWYIHAVTVVDSRALTIRGRKYLVPFADMFNYAPHAASRAADRGSHFLKYHVLGDTTFTVLADRAAHSGEQLFEDYGDNENTIYVHHHGFSPSNNPFDCFQVELPDIRKDDVTILAQKPEKEERLSKNIAAFSQHAELPAEVNRVRYGSAPTRSLLDKCLGDPYSKDSLARLQKVLAKHQEAFVTTVEHDAALLATASLEDGRRLAISDRLNRKTLLQGLIATLSGLAPAVKAPSASDAVVSEAAPASTVTATASSLSLSEIATKFNEWFAAGSPPVSSIVAAPAGEGMRLGAFANKNIAAEDVYLAVPLPLIMDLDSGYRSAIRPLFLALKQRYGNGDPFHELLFHLMYETFQLPVLGKESFWKPYLDTLPTASELNFPLYYSASDLDELQASATRESIEKYQLEVARKYEFISNLMGEYPEYFSDGVFSFENYRWAHATLDSRAIWWNGERHLVPLLDLINCIEGPDPTRVHSTRLDAAGENAITRAPWAFKSGEQVFENYGQPNHIYFHYHGFVLDSNTHDCVVVPLGIASAMTELAKKEMAARLKTAGLRPSYSACLTASTISSEDLKYVEAAYGLKARSGLRKIVELAQAQLSAYGTSVAEDEALLREPGKSWRFVSSVKFRMSEKRLLAEIASLADTSRSDL